jgi:colicin import membrane protein
METERARPMPLYMEPLRNLPIVLISLFIVVAGVDALLALQPGILQSLRAYFSAPASGGTTSSALAAAAMIVGGVALSATTLAVFIRGVRTAPYLCITPVWVCACMLAIARLHTPLPLPVPTSAFVAISALLFVSSGVLFESTSRVSNLIGTAASLLPLTLLSIGYAFNSDAQASFGSDSFLMLFVLALAAAGAPAIAVACRANGARVLGGQASHADTSLQVVELLERARLSEERAEHAERQLMASGSIPPVVLSGPRLALDDDELALSRSGGSNGWIGWAAAGVVLVATIGWYMIGVAPLRGELATAEQVNAKQVQEHTAALASMRADFERKRTDLEQQLSAAAQPTTPSSEPQPPATSPAPKTPRTIAIPDDSSDDADDADDVSASREERAAKALARKEARIARKEQAAAERAEKSAERQANLAAAKEVRAQEHEARSAERAEKAAERHAKSAERAEARAASRAERSESRGSSDADDEKADEKVERSAAAAATAALEAETYGADSSKSKRAEKTKAAPAAAPAPQKSAADVDDESSDDPLEGL